MNIPEHSTIFRNSLKYLNISQYSLEEKYCIPEYSRICNNIPESDLPERFGISFQTIIPSYSRIFRKSGIPELTKTT
jgi:hypothetical protein